MDNVVDMALFRQTRQVEVSAFMPPSAFEDCLFTDTLMDLMTIVERLETAVSGDELHLTNYEKGQLEFLAVLSDQLLANWADLGFNEIEDIDCE